MSRIPDRVKRCLEAGSPMALFPAAPAAPPECDLCEVEQPLTQDGNHHDMGGGLKIPCRRSKEYSRNAALRSGGREAELREALSQIEEASPNWLVPGAIEECLRDVREIARAALATHGAGTPAAKEEK